jgi:hypothetical protein
MKTQPGATLTADLLAAIIREVDGGHSLGAAALAEAILGHPGMGLPTGAEPVVGPADEAPEKEAPAWYNSDMASSWEAGRQDGWSDALARYGTNPTPIPVARRLPVEGDCAPWPGEPGATPWAWAGKKGGDSWVWVQLSMLGLNANMLGQIHAGGGWTHWLPFHALPLPEVKS